MSMQSLVTTLEHAPQQTRANRDRFRSKVEAHVDRCNKDTIHSTDSLVDSLTVEGWLACMLGADVRRRWGDHRADVERSQVSDDGGVDLQFDYGGIPLATFDVKVVRERVAYLSNLKFLCPGGVKKLRAQFVIVVVKVDDVTYDVYEPFPKSMLRDSLYKADEVYVVEPKNGLEHSSTRVTLV